MEKEIDLEKKIKELDNLFKVGQSAQTVHMLTKPQAFYDNIHKQALGYQNPFYLKKAQRIKPTLYDGIVMSAKHVATPVIDDEETLIFKSSDASPIKIEAPKELPKWETATCGKIWYDEDIHDLRSVETEFPAIVLNDALTSEVTLSCELMVSPLNDNKIDFRISFDESDDEDYTVIYDKNLFSYKIIFVDDLKTDSENENDKVNMPSFPSPEPMVSYFDKLDYFKDFEKEFPAIVYNDAQTSKLDFLTEPTVSPQHIDEFNLKDETSFSECDEEEQNVLYFNDLFPFNVIYPDDSKSDKDNDDDKIDIKQSLGGGGFNTAYPGAWIRRIDFLYRPCCKEIDGMVYSEKDMC
ncbi:hypothetical protein Tco_0984913 [Tanacetum coccineum]